MYHSLAAAVQDAEARGISLARLALETEADDQGRPVKILEKLTIQGKSLNVVGTISKYNQPVTITAPPPNQVSTH